MFEQLGAWLAGRRQERASTEPIDFNPLNANFFGQGVGNQPADRTLLEQNLGINDTATRAIANRIASLKPLVKISRRTADGTMEDEILDDHVLAELFAKPHPDFTLSQMLRLTGQYLVTVGKSAWLKVGNGLGVPSELHPMPADRVTPLWEGGYIVGYRAETGGRPVDLPRDVVIWTWLPDPEDIYFSEGYLAPNGSVVDGNKFAEQHLRAHYQNDATPKIAMEAGDDAKDFSADSWRNFARGWITKHNSRLGTDIGSPAKVPTGWTLKELSQQTGQEMVPLLEFWERNILKNFGVPRSILGEVVSGDRSSAETNQFVFDMHTIQPLAKMISDALTNQLAVDYDENLFVEFDGFVAEDKRFLLEQEAQDLDKKVRSVQQVRADRGIDPEAAPWGAEPVGQLGQVPYRPDEEFEAEEDESGALASDAPNGSAKGKFDEGEAITASNVLNGAQVASIVELIQNVATGLLEKSAAIELMGVAFGIDEATAAKIIGNPQEVEEASEEDLADRVLRYTRSRGTYWTPEAGWQRVLNREKKYVPLFRKLIREVFRQQRDTVLARTAKLLESRQRGMRIDVEDLWDPDEWASLFKRTTEPLREAIFLSVLKEDLPNLGLSVPPGVEFDDFVMTERMREVIREQGAQMVRQLNVTTGKRLAKAVAEDTAIPISEAIAEGVSAGESSEAIGARIRKVFNVRRKEATTIARTEVLTATTQATVEGMIQADAETKTWHTSLDQFVRHSHQIENQTVPVRDNFVLGDGELAFGPGVGADGVTPLSAGNRINCRCFVLENP